MALERIISKQGAAAMLGVDPRAVERYADKGYLKKSPGQIGNGRNAFFYFETEVDLLKIKFRDRKELDGVIREIYAGKACGMSEQEIIKQYDITKESALYNAMQIYSAERKELLKGYGIDNHEDFLLGEEVKAKLTIIDSHVIKDLIDEGLLKAKTIKKGRRKIFVIDKQSFIDYIGEYGKHRLYRSNHAADMVREMRIKDVDKIARENKIGFKIKDIGQGRYLFIMREMEQIRREFLKGNHNCYV